MSSEARPKDVRYEIKMVAQAAAYPRFRMFLHLDQAAIRELYPPRVVQSIYFDTHRDQALEENLSGISHREKIRFRWYGEARTGVRGTLERKVRENMLGWKGLLPIDAEIAVEGETRHAFARSIFQHLTPEWNDVRASALLPSQWIRYRREYYTAGKVRVTVDRELRSWDQRYRRELSASFRTPTPNVMIVEAKCSEDYYDELQAFVNRMPMHVDKCSKFVYASRPSEGAQASFMPI